MGLGDTLRRWGWLAWLGAVGCRAPSEAPHRPTVAAPATAAAQPLAEPDREALLRALSGRWQVTEPDGQTAEWVIAGVELTRRQGDQVQHGWIEVPQAGRLVVRFGAARPWFLGFAVDGPRVWIGPGRTGLRTADGRWMAYDNGWVVRAVDGRCRWYPRQMKGGHGAPQPVVCALREGTWGYDLPRRSRSGPSDGRSLRLEGSAAVGPGLHPAVRLPAR